MLRAFFFEKEENIERLFYGVTQGAARMAEDIVYTVSLNQTVQRKHSYLMCYYLILSVLVFTRGHFKPTNSTKLI